MEEKIIRDIEKLIEIIEFNIKKYDNKFLDYKGKNKLVVSLFSMFDSKSRDIRRNWFEIEMEAIKIENLLNIKLTKYDFSKLKGELKDILVSYK